MDLGGTYSNKNAQFRALQDLLHKLPASESSETPATPRKPADLPNCTQKLSPEQHNEVVAAYRAGATVYELADRFGIDRKTASRILHRHHVPMRRRGLSPTQVEQAAHLRAAGWTLARIAERLSVSARSVARRLADRETTT